MIQLKTSLLWDGHLIPAGNLISLPAELEQRLLSVGNAVQAGVERQVEPASEPPEGPDTSENPTGPEPMEAPAGPDPELKLGRGVPKV